MKEDSNIQYRLKHANADSAFNGLNAFDRRTFIEKGLTYTLAAGIGSSGLLIACKKNGKNEIEISPTEDLMQEHGLLNRVLLIYGHCRIQLLDKEDCDPLLINAAATIIKDFVEDYHEKQEENYLFPRFENAKQLTDLVSTLRIQHQAGRNVTKEILQLTKIKKLSGPDILRLTKLLDDFETMYRPHEAREDTILFPAFRKLVSKNEYDSLGEEFEKNERKHFGEDGFTRMVSKVETIEKSLGIYDLSAFTPK